MKKILIISPSTNVKGGITTVIKGYLDSELSVKYIFFNVSTHQDGSFFVKLFTAIISLFVTLYHLLSKKIDIVHIHGSDTTSSLRKYFLFKIVERFDCKVIYHFHGASFMEMYPEKNEWWKSRIKYLFKNVDLIICLSDSWADQIKLIIPSAKTLVIENAVRLPSDYREGGHQDGNQIRLLFLGLIGERKGVFDLLHVIKALNKKGYSIQLYIGGNGDVGRLKNEIISLDLEEKVFFLGWVGSEKKDSLFKNSDIYVLPSYGEGMPMSIIEAMSYGLPIVSTWVGGIPELVRDKETGFLIQPGDWDGLLDKIETLITDTDLRIQMGKSARQRIKDYYNLDFNIKKIDLLYQKLLME